MDQFRIEVADIELADLRERLARTRTPDSVPGAGWRLGTDPVFLGGLLTYWQKTFNWRAQEARLNGFPQYSTVVDGVPIHFVHCPGRGARPMPIVLSHGWPSTFAELLPLVPGLTDPTALGGLDIDSFDVVIPSLPGFGFSTPYQEVGPRRIHDLWAGLMTQLGYHRFGAAGSDIGARVTSRLGWHYPDRVLGIHLSSVDLEWPDPLPADLGDEELAYVGRTERWEREEGAYAALQSTKPQTLAFGLSDSPAGLAAWIVEKFQAWSDCSGDITARFDADELLTNITLYWVTNTINSANRSYFQAKHDPNPLSLPSGTRIEIPTGIAMFPGEADLLVPKKFAERCYNVVHWTDMPRGGHFPALEEPGLLVDDIRTFFRPLR